MLPASNRGVGMNIGFPDICLTPAAPVPIPIPYPNMAMNAMAVPFALKVMMSMMNSLNRGSKIPMTMGDEPGCANPLFKQMGMFTMGNPKVLVEGLPAVSLTMPTTGNMCNDPSGLAAVPSVTNVLLTDRDVAPQLDADACAQLGRAVSTAPLETREHDGILQVRVARFSRDLPARLFSLLRERAPRALLLDLRGCPGGMLHAALALANDFLPAGTPIVTLVDDDGDRTEHRARGQAYFMPTVTLIDEGTASAAEIFAGSLSAAGRAKTVGAQSHGKNTTASLVASLGGGATHYQTRARVELPGGCDLANGLAPDVPSDAPLRDGLVLLAAACTEVP